MGADLEAELRWIPPHQPLDRIGRNPLRLSASDAEPTRPDAYEKGPVLPSPAA
jgi:hypothetical protein